MAMQASGDNQPLPNSLWIYTMNRCTLALSGRALLWRALLGLDFITSVNAVEAA
jgi:hypothetical protein